MKELPDVEIVNNEAAGRWEARVDQQLAVAQYQRRGDMLVFTHTEVPSELEGKGIASRLIQAALDDARDTHQTVVPFCPFVASYIRRHHAYATLVPAEYHHLIEDKQANT